jgi:hypothetical protein
MITVDICRKKDHLPYRGKDSKLFLIISIRQKVAPLVLLSLDSFVIGDVCDFTLEAPSWAIWRGAKKLI